jgi:hypothetical protein
VHPVDAMPESGLSLRSLHLPHPCAPVLVESLDAIGLRQIEVLACAPNLVAVLDARRGPVALESKDV